MISREVLAQVKRIEIRTRRLVTDLFGGEYHSVFKGRGMEFAEVREYLPGDDVRPEHFKAFWFDGSKGLYIHPNVWHEAVFPVGETGRFFDRQGKVHARINCEIAEEFGISHRTVETHRERLMAKLRMGSVADLTRFVVEAIARSTPASTWPNPATVPWQISVNRPCECGITRIAGRPMSMTCSPARQSATYA